MRQNRVIPAEAIQPQPADLQGRLCEAPLARANRVSPANTRTTQQTRKLMNRTYAFGCKLSCCDLFLLLWNKSP